MRQPRLSNLTIDPVGTRKLRSRLTKTKKIKITINIDEQSLTFLRKVFRQLAPPYLWLLNQVLKEGTTDTDETKARLDRDRKRTAKAQAAICRLTRRKGFSSFSTRNPTKSKLSGL